MKARFSISRLGMQSAARTVVLGVLQDLHDHRQLVRQRWLNDAQAMVDEGPHFEVLTEA